MDAAAHDRTASRAGPTAPAALLTLLLLLCALSAPVFAARDDTELSPGVSELLRGPPSSAIPLLEREATAGDARAAAYLAVARHFGWGTPVNEASAIALTRQAEAAGYAPATLLGYFEFESPLNERQLKKATSATESIARRGDSLAQFYFARAAKTDPGALRQIRDDPTYLSGTTRKYLAKAHASGFAPATYLLGAFAAQGAGRAPDVAQAIEFWRAAAARDFAPAATVIGLFIDRGLVTDPALKAAGSAPWYEQAVALGNTAAMHHLAMLHVGGQGVPQDYARAESLLQQAVAQGRTESEGDLRFVQSALSDQKAEERRRQQSREVEERGRQARERAARAEQERQLALASATDVTATDASHDVPSDAAASLHRPASAGPRQPGHPATQPPTAGPPSGAPVSIDVPDANPSLSQLYGASLPWLILKLLGLLLLAEAVRWALKLGALPFSAGFAAGYSSDLPSGLKIFGIGFAALWLLSLAPVYYGLVAYLLWDNYRSRVADVHLARDVAKTRGALALEPGEISDSSRITLVTAPDWSPGGPVTIRVRNDDQRADLAVVTAECTFYLGNEQESHREPFSFELRPPLPAGFGTLVEARSKPTLQYENSDYQHRVDCHVTSALLRTPPDYPEVRIVSVRHDSDCRFGTSSGTGCLRFAIENLAGRAIDDIEISCIAGYEPTDVSWKEFSNFRREFAQKDQPLVPAATTTEVIASADSPPWPDDTSPRCDVTDVEWR